MNELSTILNKKHTIVTIIWIKNRIFTYFLSILVLNVNYYLCLS
ncbi:hypothetical protein HMPREF3203_00797 [Proteus mirabilis]|nr:hypothetical protein HMPREF3203_00797 [Proteus mirabilis]